MLDRLKQIFKRKDKRIVRTSDVLNLTHVAMIVADGFEESEVYVTKDSLERAGACVSIISIHPGSVRGWNHRQWGKNLKVDATIIDSWSVDFDFLVIPGGVLSLDILRKNDDAVEFTRSFIHRHRPVAAICHGPQLLIETDLLKGVTLTSAPAIKTDLENAGAKWVDKEVVVDHHYITSRRPADLPAFNRAMIEEFSNKKNYPPLPNTEGYVVTL